MVNVQWLTIKDWLIDLSALSMYVHKFNIHYRPKLHNTYLLYSAARKGPFGWRHYSYSTNSLYHSGTFLFSDSGQTAYFSPTVGMSVCSRKDRLSVVWYRTSQKLPAMLDFCVLIFDPYQTLNDFCNVINLKQKNSELDALQCFLCWWFSKWWLYFVTEATGEFLNSTNTTAIQTYIINLIHYMADHPSLISQTSQLALHSFGHNGGEVPMKVDNLEKVFCCGIIVVNVFSSINGVLNTKYQYTEAIILCLLSCPIY